MNDIFARYPGAHAPRIPVLSTCRKEKFVDAFTPSYFWDNCRNAVLFSDAISHSHASSSPIFLEISCHPVLSSYILARGVPDNRVLCPMRRISAKTPSSSSNEPGIFLDALGRLSLLGCNALDLSGLYGFSAFKSKLIEHPLTARVIPPPKSVSTRRLQSTPDSSGPLASSTLRINKTSHPDLAEHVINGIHMGLSVL
jgi:acyl transferase domain-containing protein